MNLIKKTMMILFLSVSALTLQGCGLTSWLDWLFGPCESSCYSGGSGYSGGNIGIGNDYVDDTWSPHPDRENPPRYVERPTNPDREREVETGRDREREKREREKRPTAHTTIQNATLKLMTRYDLPADSALAMAQHLITLRTGRTYQISELGITQDDLNKMSQGHNPSAFALKTMSYVLNLELDQTHDLIQKIKMDLSSGQF